MGIDNFSLSILTLRGLILPFVSLTKFHKGCQSHVTWHNCVVPSHLVQVLTGQKNHEKSRYYASHKERAKKPSATDKNVVRGWPDIFLHL